jgi:hypothetical protein
VEVSVVVAQVDGSISIAAGATATWSIYGYSAFDVANFSLSVFGGLGEYADATLVQGEKFVAGDGSQGYLLYITNNDAYDSCTAYILENCETAPTS